MPQPHERLEKLFVVNPDDPESEFLKVIIEDSKAKIISEGITVEFEGAAEFLSTVKGTGFLHGTDVIYDSADVVISSTELKALNATPKTLVAAPGANKVLVPLHAIWFLDYNSAAYAGIAAGEDIAIRYTDGSGQFLVGCEITGFLDQTEDTYAITHAYAPILPLQIGAVNAPLVAAMATGEITTGDSPLAVRLSYATIDLSTLTTS